MDNNTINLFQQQKQNFSPKLIPALRILQMGYYDLEKMIATTLMDNPFSEVTFDEMSNIEVNMQEVDYKTVNKNNTSDEKTFEICSDDENNLLSHVMMQLSNVIKSNREQQIVEFLVTSLDSKGYMMECIDELCILLDLCEKELHYYLNLIQNVEPFGLGAKSLQECLLIQLKHLHVETSLAENIVCSYLNDVGEHKYAHIAKKEAVSMQEVMLAIDMIKSLNPLPANGFARSDQAVYIIPDVYIVEDEGTLIVELNNRYESSLKINEQTMNLYKNSDLDKESKTFLANKLKDFQWLRYSTSRRSNTLKRIVEILIISQQNFLLSSDKKQLKPLRLSDIEEISGLHQSTISRAIQDKFFHCKFGTFPLKLLMPRTYAKDGEVTASKYQVKAEIMEIIQLEDKTNPLSDQKIQEYLIEEGFKISRRSVSLYREELHIPIAKHRKEDKDTK